MLFIKEALCGLLLEKLLERAPYRLAMGHYSLFVPGNGCGTRGAQSVRERFFDYRLSKGLDRV